MSAERDVSSVDTVAKDFATLTFEVVESSDTSTENNITAQVQFNLDDGRVANLRGKVDTGAQGKILPIRLFRQMFPERVDKTGRPRDGMLKPSSVVLKAYGGFFVTETTEPALFGLPLIKGLNLLGSQKDVDNVTSTSTKQPLNKVAVLAEFPECFDSIDELKGSYHITLDTEVEPVINSPRRVPIALKDEIKAELTSMEHQGVIEKVQEGQPTDCVNSIVYQGKSNGKLWICLEPRDLNTAIKREHHVTPTLEDIIPKMSGAKYFSTVDAKCGYWNVRLDEQLSFLTTFNSPYGRYRFKQMPFGMKISQNIFQARIDQLAEGLAEAVAIADDIVIFGATQEEHDENLIRLLARCREHELKLNPDKSQISQPEVKF